MSGSVVVCALACRYPEAANPRQFWRNLMHGRRAFRALPDARLPLAAYTPERVGVADSITPVLAGLITDWQFDRARFQVPKGSYEATDLTHWLALELTAEMLDGLGGTGVLRRESTAVIVANTLTGEFSRAGLTRLRRPFLDEILSAALEDAGADETSGEVIRALFAKHLTERLPEPSEDTLAGGLANTIAGRIANYFDFNGGAYTVDGACSSSLLAVHNAASMLMEGAADTVIAGAVDLSLDPFELIGFSRNGALSATRMRVFDERSDGFWPGEGAGVAVFKREEDARREGLPILARLRGWAMSTDGAGGLTRPDEAGQRLACERALAKADVAPQDVAYVEAHGTGTPVGDPTEIRALASLNAGRAAPLRIGSVKANIGHTKAAAGFAGLIKIVQGFSEGAIPPHVTGEMPSRAFAETGDVVAPLQSALPIGEAPLIAGLSSFGFGGINVHTVFEKPATTGRPVLRDAPKRLDATDPGAELFLFKADDTAGLVAALDDILPVLPSLSLADMADMARDCARRAQFGACRLAFVAARPEVLAARAVAARDWLQNGAEASARPQGIHADLSGERREICLLFSGQAAPVRAPSPLWLRRFPVLQPLVGALPDAIRPGDADTANAQPAISFANLAGLRVLEHLGVEADDAIGHSLGELASCVWAGAMEPEAALALAAERGRIMAEFGAADGAMIRLGAAADDCEALLAGSGCALACLNGPQETVIAGQKPALERVVARAKGIGIEVQRLKTSHAFHSADMAPAQVPFAEAMARVQIGAATRVYTSTIPARTDDLRARLVRQLVDPVMFAPALAALQARKPLFVECGPGSGLARLAQVCGHDAVALDSQGPSLEPLLEVCATLYAAGQDIDTGALFADRGLYSAPRRTPPGLLSNPCGSRAALPGTGATITPVVSPPLAPSSNPEPVPTAEVAQTAVDGATPLDVVLGAVCAETGLPLQGLDPGARFQSDLHMNSLAVVRVAMASARALGLRFLGAPSDFADGNARDLAEALAELAEAGGDDAQRRINGVQPWFRPYGMQWEAAPFPAPGNATNAVRIVVPTPFDRAAAETLFAQLQAAAGEGKVLEILHCGAPLSAFLRSAFLEQAFSAITAIDLGEADAADPRVATLCAAARNGAFHEYRLQRDDGLSVPVFAPMEPVRTAAGQPCNPAVILAVGCHRGIGTECALTAAGADTEIIFIGRSRADDREILETLETARARGVAARYLRCDVGDSRAVADLAARVGGPAPDMLLYAPALNVPQKLGDLAPESVSRTLAPKTTGLLNVLEHFGDGLTRLVAFGSIIGRIGLEGECHYALANAMQSQIVEAFAESHPDCAALSLEWTVWSGVGMGERLGIVERLGALGVDALPFDAALRLFEDMLVEGATGTVCMTGRYGDRADLRRTRGLVSLRFTEEILVDYPGTELVVQTRLTPGRDLYLRDHRVMGHDVFPGVMALEAMAQTAQMLDPEAQDFAVIRDVAFDRAVVVPPDGAQIRIAVLREPDGTISAAVFSEDDQFSAPCLSARFAQTGGGDGAVDLCLETAGVCLGDAAPLYGPVFFHGALFARVGAVSAVTSRQVSAQLTHAHGGRWFGGYEAQSLLLGDPSISDAAMHMLQLAVPHRRVLPLHVAQIVRLGRISDTVRIDGRENWARAGEYSFDMAGYDAEGRCTFHWCDARFAALAAIDTAAALTAVPALAEPLLERMARERLDDSARVAFVHDATSDRAARRQVALKRMALADGRVLRRADGRPILPEGEGYLSLSHGPDVTLALRGEMPVGCDLTDPGERFPEGLNAETQTAAEVRRKLGLAEPFAADRTHEALTELTIALAPLPFVITMGRLALTPPDTEDMTARLADWEAAE
ncbi:SDR family NAD(P)-dependent oxidoreductase [Primorskyibacter sp. 2E107]|uniref:SDR family NAD(P)-dependent oxidoreductase n=1 Tax=Primorskyibacter sp. 2E107 TaxID=3403458 RepID=UPI003AF930B9